MRRLLLSLTVIFSFLLLAAGCSVKNANSLVRMAIRDHGDADVVSKVETEDHTEVILKDKLQGFEYKVTSRMDDINVDGAHFGSLPGTYDGFDTAVQTFATEEARSEINKICERYGAEFVVSESVFYSITIGPDVTEENGIKAICETAEAIQQYNLQGRLDGFEISLKHDDAWLKQYYDELILEHGTGIYDDPEYSHILSSSGGGKLCHIGSVKLPDTSFRDKAREQEDYYLRMAKMNNDKAVFVRKEERSFADTGLPLDRVQDTYDENYPKKMEDPVVYYYFEAEGKEFFICDFLDKETQTWYTDFGK